MPACFGFGTRWGDTAAPLLHEGILSEHAAVPYHPSVNRSFRFHLQGILAQRCEANPRYSLRSFARQLAVNHSTLSQMLRGKRPFSERTIRAFGKKLRIDPLLIERFVDHEKRFPSNHSSGEVETQHRILEIASQPGFKPDVSWMARVLDLSADAIHVALTQLLAMGLLRMEEHDRWTVLKERTHGRTGRSVANPGKGSREG